MENESNKKVTFMEKTERFIVESGKSIGKYIVGKIVTSGIIGILAFIIFRILGINMAWLLALILAVTNFVPMIGPWIGLIVCGVIIVFFEPIFALYTSLTALLLQILEQFVLLPLVVGKAVDLKPMLIICVLIIGSLAFGFWGVVLAIPIAAVLKVGYNIFVKKRTSTN